MSLRKIAGSAPATSSVFLLANSEIYQRLVTDIRSMGGLHDTESLLERVRAAASFAAQFHPGRFADGAIETIAQEVGADLSRFASGLQGLPFPIARQGERRRRILHVASQVAGVGGHTRMLHHWVRNDRTSRHSLVVVHQTGEWIPRWLAESVRDSGSEPIIFPAVSLIQKAWWLREIARRHADLVVLHHDSSDLVPLIAFAAPECPPVAVLNHADHQFWLGSSVADLVINLRTKGAEHTARRRFVAANAVLPIPLPEPEVRLSRRDARDALGIAEDQIMLLSIGRSLKFQPCGTYDFVATANQLLNHRPNTHLYVVGQTAAGIAPSLRCAPHERLHFVGSLEDPSLYRTAADIFLEPFPFGSQTALLEAALHGLAVIPAYGPLSPLLVANDDALEGVLENPCNEHEYLDRANVLITHQDQRTALGQVLRERLLIDHIGEGWLNCLAALYRQTDRLVHGPRAIPVSRCGTTDADIGLSLWNVMADGRTNSTVPEGNVEVLLLRHKAYISKLTGDYATARRCAGHALWLDPARWASWRLFAVTALGRTGPMIRRVWRGAN
jgi:hypothetical protein